MPIYVSLMNLFCASLRSSLVIIDQMSLSSSVVTSFLSLKACKFMSNDSKIFCLVLCRLHTHIIIIVSLVYVCFATTSPSFFSVSLFFSAIPTPSIYLPSFNTKQPTIITTKMAPNLAWGEPRFQNLSQQNNKTNLTHSYPITHNSVNNNNTTPSSPTTKVFIPILVTCAITLVIGAMILRFLASSRLSKARQTEQRAHTHHIMAVAAHQQAAYALEVLPIVGRGEEFTDMTRPLPLTTLPLPPPVYRALPARGEMKLDVREWEDRMMQGAQGRRVAVDHLNLLRGLW